MEPGIAEAAPALGPAARPELQPAFEGKRVPGRVQERASLQGRASWAPGLEQVRSGRFPCQRSSYPESFPYCPWSYLESGSARALRPRRSPTAPRVRARLASAAHGEFGCFASSNAAASRSPRFAAPRLARGCDSFVHRRQRGQRTRAGTTAMPHSRPPPRAGLCGVQHQFTRILTGFSRGSARIHGRGGQSASIAARRACRRQDRELMAQHQDLQLLRLRLRDQRDKPDYPQATLAVGKSSLNRPTTC